MCLNKVTFSLCVFVYQRDAGQQDKDIYEEFLTQKEIQGNINLVNGQSVSQSASQIASQTVWVWPTAFA